MNSYPYSTPIILTDSIFASNGGQVGDMTLGQRTAAYLAAEIQATQYIGTLLQPTIVTGTFAYQGNNFVVTDYGYVHRILSVTLLSIDNTTTCTFSEDTGCAFIRDDTFGYLDISCILKTCGCPSSILTPYQYRIVYEAGLPVGVASLPTILLGLTMAAQLVLNEMKYPSANETSGDVGVESFSSQGYSEKRKTLKRTAFGQSAKANFVAHLFDTSGFMKARRALYL